MVVNKPKKTVDLWKHSLKHGMFNHFKDDSIGFLGHYDRKKSHKTKLISDAIY